MLSGYNKMQRLMSLKIVMWLVIMLLQTLHNRESDVGYVRTHSVFYALCHRDLYDLFK